MNPFTRFGFVLSLSLAGLCASAPRAHADTIADKGDFLVAYPLAKTAEHQAMRSEFKEAKLLETIAESLNEAFALPSNITISIEELGQVNAFYYPSKRRITLSYELMDEFDTLFATTSKDPDVVSERMLNATMFVLFHELGHALIHVYDLPITGKEEDAVDQLSFVILGDSEDPKEETNDNNQMVLDGAQAFLLLGESREKTVSQMQFWDSHSLGKQRFYNILALVYGSNPTKYAYLVQKNILPKSRAEGAAWEHRRVSKAWENLLSPYMKD